MPLRTDNDIKNRCMPSAARVPVHRPAQSAMPKRPHTSSTTCLAERDHLPPPGEAR
jgi:hypothetical protein